MNQERLMQVILSPHVSEKGTRVADANRQFVFKVLPNADKTEIKAVGNTINPISPNLLENNL